MNALMPPTFHRNSFLGNVTMNASTIRQAWTFPCPKAGQIEEVAILFQTVATPQAMRVSLQDRASGQSYPDDVQDQFCDLTPVANTVVTVGPITHDGTSGGTRRTVAKHEYVCVVLEWVSTQGSAVVRLHTGSSDWQMGAVWTHRRTGSWQANDTSGYQQSCLAVRYTGDTAYTYIQGLQPSSADSGTVTVTAATTPDEVGVRFLAPYTGARLAALYGYFAVSQTNNSDFDLVLYDSADVVLQTTRLTNQQASAFSSALSTVLDFDRASLVELVKDQEYRVTIKPVGTGNVIVPYQDVGNVNRMGATPMGAGCYWTQRTDAGAWSNTTTRAPAFALVFDADIPEPTEELVFNPDDRAVVGLVWVEAYLPT